MYAAGADCVCCPNCQEFGYVHLSAGELLREEASSGSDVGQRIEDDMRNGRIVPVAITIGLLRKASDQTPRYLMFVCVCVCVRACVRVCSFTSL